LDAVYLVSLFQNLFYMRLELTHSSLGPMLRSLNLFTDCIGEQGHVQKSHD
jgi:hypothetical protein